MSGEDNAQQTKSRNVVRRVLKWIGVIFLLLFLAAGAALVLLNEERPDGDSPEQADVFARAIEEATGQDAWDEIPAISWTFAERNAHLWDRARSLHFVRFANGTEVRLCLDSQGGDVLRATDDSEAETLVYDAFGLFYNDSFWLNPFGKFFDPGVSRLMTRVDGRDALRVEFSSGGRTPGDVYVVFVDDNHLPTEWKMWVSIIPVGGLSATWTEWRDLGSGAMVSERHAIGPRDLLISDVVAGELSDVADSFGFDNDPFEGLSCAR